MAQAKDSNGSMWKVALAIMQVIVLVGLPVIGWSAAKVVNHEGRITGIESSMPREVPPAWFLQRVDRLELTVQRNSEILMQNQQLLVQLQKTVAP